MRLLDGRLLQMTRRPLELTGHSFYAFALYIADTAGPLTVYEYRMEGEPPRDEPAEIAYGLRSTIRRRQTSAQTARTVGVIVDSIAGPFKEAVDGIYGPLFRRMAITELEDRNGRCRRVEREYHFAKEESEDGRKPTSLEFGRVVFGATRVTRCEPRRYWPQEKVGETPVRPRLATPIVRPLSISSLDNYYSVVGRLSGALTVFDDSIVVKLDSLVATRRLPNDQQRIRLDSIRVGVGVGDDKTWSPVDDSKALPVGLILPKGDVIERQNVEFMLPHQRREADDKSWLVVTFHITVGDPGESGYSQSATTYAHSKPGVLAADK